MARRFPIVLTLQIDGPADPVSGLLREGNSWSTPFIGWIGLASALEDALRDRPEDEGSSLMTTPGDGRERRPDGGD